MRGIVLVAGLGIGGYFLYKYLNKSEAPSVTMSQPVVEITNGSVSRVTCTVINNCDHDVTETFKVYAHLTWPTGSLDFTQAICEVTLTLAALEEKIIEITDNINSNINTNFGVTIDFWIEDSKGNKSSVYQITF